MDTCRQRGFSLIELLIVVIIIMIIAAIAIPGLLRARISANESGAIGDTRVVLSATHAYASSNAGFFDGNLGCLNTPAICIPGYPANSPTFLDPNLANEKGKSGYARDFIGGAAPPGGTLPPQASPSSVFAYVYLSSPLTVGRTGVRGFGGDSSGILCANSQGNSPPTKGNIELDLTAGGGNCDVLQ
jgi:type IV pilus assembly protein PilA